MTNLPEPARQDPVAGPPPARADALPGQGTAAAGTVGRRGRAATLTAVLLVTACGADSGADSLAPPQTPELPGQAARCDHFDPLRQPFFGDLHVHTRYSLDASTQGTRLGPFDAYAFATGEEIGIQPFDADGNPRRRVQLARPIDFAAVTDHAEFFGELEICANPEAPGHNSLECLLLENAEDLAFLSINSLLAVPALPTLDGQRRIPRLPYCGLDGERCRQQAITPWVEMQQAAEAFYDRSSACRFSTFVGYEWTGSPGSNNLHRNVLFANETVPAFPPSYLDFPSIERLWAALDTHCDAEAGCASLTIPHNSNLAGGLYFEPTDEQGRPYDTAFAADRRHNEPLIEVYQHKGDSECLNTEGAGMQDELCGFEKIPYDNLSGSSDFAPLTAGEPKERDFIRPALKEGLRLQRALGVNPFEYGFVGSSDTHIAAPGQTSEADFPGHGGAGQANRDELPPGLTDLIEFSPGGLAVLWAEENRRESLFAAMRRREAYATSGTRPIVRFFAGWDLPEQLCAADDFVQQGYDRGVPMGGEIGPQPEPEAALRMAVWALRDAGQPDDPAQALQRIQIIKGWLAADGSVHERVLDVAGDPDNGATVDLTTCDTVGTGFASLCTVWEDDDFDPLEPAFYYARVVENPSCRWSTRQCLAAGVDCNVPETVSEGFEACCSADFPATIQERAWTSPVWYRPDDAG